MQAAAQELIDYTQNITEERDELMFPMDVPYVPAQEAPILLAQTSAPTNGDKLQPDFILNACKETVSTGDMRSAMRAVDPAYLLRNYLITPTHDIVLSAIKTALLEDTRHGKISPVVDNLGRSWYRYDPEPEYVGNDRAVFIAEYMNKHYKIVVDLHVFDGVTPGDIAPYVSSCPPAKLIKVNGGKPVSGYDLNNISVTQNLGVSSNIPTSKFF